MKEKDKIRIWNTASLAETAGIRSRCTVSHLQNQLRLRFPEESFRVDSVTVNETGVYQRKGLARLRPVRGLPPYCEVEISVSTGDCHVKVIVWSPLAWNDRFAGTAGGGMLTGGAEHITAPNNLVRGWKLPYAVINGFTAATADSGNIRGQTDLVFDPATRELNYELLENWRARGTHLMTLFGKATAEILHERPVLYAYMSGGSGGGRQCLVEAQEFPGDYDGIWASCPAINWTKFLLMGLWPIAVMNSYQNILPPHKINVFRTAVHDSVGGSERYFRLEEPVEFDPQTLVGKKTRDGEISLLDAVVMAKIWEGPSMWYGFRPGLKFWNVGLPIGAFYYSLFGKKPKPFFLVPLYARWITRDPEQDFSTITIEEFEELMQRSINEFPREACAQASLHRFAEAGGKLIVDHGLDDPLIPVDGTIDYYRRVCAEHGGKDKVDEFFRLYLTPGDGHGDCYGNGPGITLAEGLRALIKWVEEGEAPQGLRVVQAKRVGGEIVRTGVQQPH